MLASCSPQPNWMPRNPKLMLNICQKLRRGLSISRSSARYVGSEVGLWSWVCEGAPSGPPNSKRVGHAVDVVEPRRDERDLQDGTVIEADGAETLVVLRRYARRVLRQLHDVIEHHALGLADRRRRVIAAQRVHERRIECHPTQKLCV